MTSPTSTSRPAARTARLPGDEPMSSSRPVSRRARAVYKLLRASAGTLTRYVRRRVERARQRRAGTAGTLEIAIVIMVSDEVHNHMRRLQLDFRERYGVDSGLRASPHVTLKQSFRTFDASSVERLERYVDELVADVEPLEIRVKGVTAFEEEILFVEVEPNPRLEALRRRVLHDLSERFGIAPGHFEGDNYHFHATLEYDLSSDVLAAARGAFADTRIEYAFTLSTLGLLLKAGDGWTTYKRARLSKAVAEPLPVSRGVS